MKNRMATLQTLNCSVKLTHASGRGGLGEEESNIMLEETEKQPKRRRGTAGSTKSIYVYQHATMLTEQQQMLL